MTLERLPTEKWGPWMDELSSSMKGLQVDLEVCGRDIGDQIQARRTRLLGLTYDAGQDLLQVAVEGETHLLHHPRDIAYDTEAGRIRYVAATDDEGRTHQVRFRQAVARLQG